MQLNININTIYGSSAIAIWISEFLDKPLVKITNP